MIVEYQITDVRSQTLFDAMGGAETFFRIARLMHDRMSHDDLLGDKFTKADATHVPHLGMWLCEVFGGPKLYSVTLGDIGLMLARHAGQDIAEGERSRFVAIANQAVADCAPADAHEAVAAISRYFAWGSHIAVTNSCPGHVANPAAGVPTWDWDSGLDSPAA